eukprot:COSAG01_NODE_49132_length_375_cov_0.318841_1_plen_112_part_10
MDTPGWPRWGTMGVVGRALRFPPRASLQIGCPCNIPLRRATLSLWVRSAPESPASGPPQQQTVFRFMGTELMIAAAGNRVQGRLDLAASNAWPYDISRPITVLGNTSAAVFT